MFKSMIIKLLKTVAFDEIKKAIGKELIEWLEEKAKRTDNTVDDTIVEMVKAYFGLDKDDEKEDK